MKEEKEEMIAKQNKLEKQLNAEKVLKQQAINKLAEVMNRKDASKDNKKNKVCWELCSVNLKMGQIYPIKPRWNDCISLTTM